MSFSESSVATENDLSMPALYPEDEPYDPDKAQEMVDRIDAFTSTHLAMMHDFTHTTHGNRITLSQSAIEKCGLTISALEVHRSILAAMQRAHLEKRREIQITRQLVKLVGERVVLEARLQCGGNDDVEEMSQEEADSLAQSQVKTVVQIYTGTADPPSHLQTVRLLLPVATSFSHESEG